VKKVWFRLHSVSHEIREADLLVQLLLDYLFLLENIPEIRPYDDPPIPEVSF